MAHSSGLQIVVDENVVEARQAFSPFGEVTTVPATSITPASLRAADVLMVRSVTKVDEALLTGSRVRFVGSATIGTDHVDRGYLESRGIRFESAPGSNAGSVAEYVVAALLSLAKSGKIPVSGATVGLVGCGNIGGMLAERLPGFGLQVLLNDPPLEKQALRAGRSHSFLPLNEVLERADILSIHVPLTRQGPLATRHLIDGDRLQTCKRGCALINSSRGPVVDNRELLRAVRSGKLGALVLDVWEDEPKPDQELVDLADIATPHIAGYSYDGKLMGTLMLRDSLANYLNVTPDALNPTNIPGDKSFQIKAKAGVSDLEQLYQITRRAYPILRDDAAMKRAMASGGEDRGRTFSNLRRSYPARYAFERYEVHGYNPTLVAAVRNGLRMRTGDKSG